MVKKSLLKKEEKKKIMYMKFFHIIRLLKIEIKKCTNVVQKWELRMKLQLFPKNAFLIRQRNRCFVSGRSRAFLKRFGLCRIKLRELAMNGEIPGLLKSSW